MSWSQEFRRPWQAAMRQHEGYSHTWVRSSFEIANPRSSPTRGSLSEWTRAHDLLLTCGQIYDPRRAPEITNAFSNRQISTFPRSEHALAGIWSTGLARHPASRTSWQDARASAAFQYFRYSPISLP